MSYDLKKRKLSTLYRIAISEDNELDLRYSAARTMQRIRKEQKQMVTDIPPSIIKILQRSSLRRKRKAGIGR